MVAIPSFLTSRLLSVFCEPPMVETDENALVRIPLLRFAAPSIFAVVCLVNGQGMGRRSQARMHGRLGDLTPRKCTFLTGASVGQSISALFVTATTHFTTEDGTHLSLTFTVSLHTRLSLGTLHTLYYKHQHSRILSFHLLSLHPAPPRSSGSPAPGINGITSRHEDHKVAQAACRARECISGVHGANQS